MPLCLVCRTDKPLEEFWADRTRSDDRSRACKDCTRARKMAKAQAGYIKMRQYLAAKGCLGCGNRDFRVLDFDHTEPKANGWVTSLVAKYGWEHHLVQAEVDKCEVRCANCHRIRHWIER